MSKSFITADHHFFHENIEEMFDDLDAAYDDYPEITQQDFDRAVKRKGLKPFPADKKG